MDKRELPMSIFRCRLMPIYDHVIENYAPPKQPFKWPLE